jgi:hypothetical protein
VVGTGVDPGDLTLFREGPLMSRRKLRTLRVPDVAACARLPLAICYSNPRSNHLRRGRDRNVT